MLNIALLGYGKMNKLVEQLATAQGHRIVLTINSSNPQDLHPDKLALADVAVDFSTPTVAFEHLTACIKAGLPVVVGTTAWLSRLAEAEALVKEYNGTLFYAANFSLGVNIFFQLNSLLAKLLKQNPAYNIAMEEIHHTTKLDAPSGTALVLAKDWLQSPSRYEDWQLGTEAQPNGSLMIDARREPNVVGTHILTAQSGIDTIRLEHVAHSREGFAAGALAAAQWLQGKKGVFTMQNLLADALR